MYSVIGELRVNNRPKLNRSSTVEPYPSISLDLRTKFTQNMCSNHSVPLNSATKWTNWYYFTVNHSSPEILHCIVRKSNLSKKNDFGRCFVYYAIHKRCGRSDEQSKIHRKSKLRYISDKKKTSDDIEFVDKGETCRIYILHHCLNSLN